MGRILIKNIDNNMVEKYGERIKRKKYKRKNGQEKYKKKRLEKI